MRVFEPFPSDHPAVTDKLPCPVCGRAFKTGDVTRLVNLVPSGEEARALAAAGRAHTAEGELAHSTCFVAGDKVAVTHCGRSVPGVVLIVNKYGTAGAVAFEAILGGYVRMMPVVTSENGEQTDLIKGEPVEIKLQ